MNPLFINFNHFYIQFFHPVFIILSIFINFYFREKLCGERKDYSVCCETATVEGLEEQIDVPAPPSGSPCDSKRAIHKLRHIILTPPTCFMLKWLVRSPLYLVSQEYYSPLPYLCDIIHECCDCDKILSIEQAATKSWSEYTTDELKSEKLIAKM